MLEALVRGLRARGHEIVVYCTEVAPRYERASLAKFGRLAAGGPSGTLRAFRLWLSSRKKLRRGSHDVVVHMGRTGPLDVYRAGGGCHRTWIDLLRARAHTRLQNLKLLLAPRHWFLLWHERRALSAGGAFVVPSERARADLLAAYGPLGEGVVVIANGVDLDRFHPKVRQLWFAEQREALNISPEQLVLLFVGSDPWRKGLDRVLAALAQLAPRREELLLLVLGEPRDRSRWESDAERLGVRSRVAFLPPRDAPEKLYAAADLLVLPTRHDPFANVTLEALACGLPVITSARNGASGELGASDALVVLEDDDDSVECAQHIERLLDPATLPGVRAAARAQAEAHGEGPFLDAWEQLLQRVVEERRG